MVAVEVLETGVDHGEKQRPMVLAAERLGGGGQVPFAGSDETRWPKAASNPHEGELVPEAGVEPACPYGQGILSHINTFIINNYRQHPPAPHRT